MVLLLVFVISHFQSNECINYSREALEAKYPQYGTGWVPMGQDENGEWIIGYLNQNGSDGNSRFLSDPSGVVTFTLFTRQHSNGTIIEDSLKRHENIFDKNKPVKCVTHGWMSRGTADTCIQIKNGFLEKYDANVIIMDWSLISDNIFYPVPMAATRPVGDYYAKLLNEIVELGVDPENIHLVGHSLGAHVSGFAARGVKKGKIGRLTGLDPALPGFNNIELVNGGRINKDDAHFVDVIHTTAGFLGLATPLGHCDFYPNGGSVPQPGCGNIFEMMEACSHGRSWKYFAESLVTDIPFIGHRCNSSDNFKSSTCKGPSAVMGDATPHDTRGDYYLVTQDDPPYALKDVNNDVDNSISRK